MNGGVVSYSVGVALLTPGCRDLSFYLKIFLTGGGSHTPGLAEFISERLKIDTAIFEPFENMEVKNDLPVQLQSQFATALGLSIRGGLVNA